MSSRPLSAKEAKDGPSSGSQAPGRATLDEDPNLEEDHRADKGAKTAGLTSKRNACLICRKRKLRCDGGQPSCTTCARLHHDCTYVESRRKSGPRRGYVRTLETRLAQVEALLKRTDTVEPSNITSPREQSNKQPPLLQSKYVSFDLEPLGSQSALIPDDLNPFPDISQSQAHTKLFAQLPEVDFSAPLLNDDLYEGISWAMIELGVDEPLPPEETIDDLNALYFSKVHPSYPMINEYRFRAEMNRSPQTRPSVALRYAMWANAASTADRYRDLHPHFYARARKYAEADEMTGRHKYINVRHAQAWLLICTYEYKFMHFPHAWLTTGRATRLTQMMGLHRLDGGGAGAKQTVPDSSDWSEKEERRRTFWMAFCKDRNGSIGTGWPMIIDERDIATNMPSSEEAYARNEEVPGISLAEAMQPQSATHISAFAGVVITSALSGRTLLHLQRPSPKDDDHDLNGEFWKAHRKIDNILLNTSLYLPSHLRLPAGTSNSNIIFLNMGLQAANIIVHQAAIVKAEKFGLAASIVTESTMRCIAAATQITSIMRMIAHLDLSVLNTYTTFVLFLATRIFVQAVKKDPDDVTARTSARFLLSALTAMKVSIPLADIYIVQLELEGISLDTLQETNTGLETIVANISLKDDISDPSWVNFVSPVVRIVERESSDGSGYRSSSSPSKNASSTGHQSGSDKTNNAFSSEIGNIFSRSPAENNASYFPGGTSYVPMTEMPEFMDDFVGAGENWDFANSTSLPMSSEVFDALMDLESGD